MILRQTGYAQNVRKVCQQMRFGFSLISLSVQWKVVGFRLEKCFSFVCTGVICNYMMDGYKEEISLPWCSSNDDRKLVLQIRISVQIVCALVFG